MSAESITLRVSAEEEHPRSQRSRTLTAEIEIPTGEGTEGLSLDRPDAGGPLAQLGALTNALLEAVAGEMGYTVEQREGRSVDAELVDPGLYALREMDREERLLRDDVKARLRKGPATFAELWQALGASRPAVDAALRSLEAEGLVKEEAGVWKLSGRAGY